MITVFILTAQLSGGFTMMPHATEALCYAAMDGLAAVARAAECYEIEMIAPSGSVFAPELAPLPAPKPGEFA